MLFRGYSTTTSCDIEGSNCNYRVTCYYHPGTASNPSCSDEPNVTFVIKSSTASTITTAFFGATNFDTRVRFIQAVNNTWMSLGSLAFRYYHKVKQIDLSGNFIYEIQDETFRTLVPLNYLNLSNNMIAELNPKSLLITDSKSTDLETLDLSYNKLSHISEEVLAHLPSLISLYLQGNKLKSLSDSCFGSQKFLMSLYLQHNYIERLNMTLINLKQLKYLDLSYNYIRTISGYETNRLQALEKINISNNVLQNIESNCFVQSANLQSVDLSFNLIVTPIENLMFSANIKLDYLNLYDNLIPSIEGNSFKHNILTYLNLKNNKISGEIKDNTFAGLQNITEFDLSGQNITMIRNYGFADMEGLLNLNLSRNHINVIENASFYNLSVRIVDVSYNNISKLNFLSDSLYNLIELYLNNNNIKILFKNTFDKQNLLQKLDLSENNLLIIEKNSLPLENLQYLNMVNNHLVGELRSNMLSPAKFLRSLDFSNFNITKISNKTFIDMPVLARLNLSHNAIDKIEPDNFIGMDNLYGIDISYNKLSDLQFNNSLLTKLKAAYLNNNMLTNISRIFPTASDILYLDMSNNGFSDLSHVDSKLFPELQTLHLSYNSIENFNNPGTNTLSNLVDLGLSSNKIKTIDLSYFKELVIVDLNNNNLCNINITFFKNLEFVQSMDLSQNNISDVPPGTFQNMMHLKMFNISSNYISKLRYGSLKGLNKTELLDISNNIIESLDVHIFHECPELKTLIIDYNRIKVLDIERLVLVTQRSLKTLSLGGNPISCQEIIRNATLKDRSIVLNQIEVTSVHKIYHEDNVHGIKCGDDDVTTTTVKLETTVKPADNDGFSSLVVIIWCAVLTVILLGIVIGVYIKYKKDHGGQVYYRESRVHLSSSLEI